MLTEVPLSLLNARHIQLGPHISGHIVLQNAIRIGLKIRFAMHGVDAIIIAAVYNKPCPLRQRRHRLVRIFPWVVPKHAPIGLAVRTQRPSAKNVDVVPHPHPVAVRAWMRQRRNRLIGIPLRVVDPRLGRHASIDRFVISPEDIDSVSVHSNRGPAFLVRHRRGFPPGIRRRIIDMMQIHRLCLILSFGRVRVHVHAAKQMELAADHGRRSTESPDRHISQHSPRSIFYLLIQLRLFRVPGARHPTPPNNHYTPRKSPYHHYPISGTRHPFTLSIAPLF